MSKQEVKLSLSIASIVSVKIVSFKSKMISDTHPMDTSRDTTEDASSTSEEDSESTTKPPSKVETDPSRIPFEFRKIGDYF